MEHYIIFPQLDVGDLVFKLKDFVFKYIFLKFLKAIDHISLYSDLKLRLFYSTVEYVCGLVGEFIF